MSVYIVSAQRTPIGRFQGGLSSLEAPELGARVISSLLKNKNIPIEKVDECIMGQVLTAGSGQAPARQSAIRGGLKFSTSCTTINKVCGSGLKAILLGYDTIKLNRAHLVVAGGQESMSLAPHILKKSRIGFRLGETPLIDSILEDGLVNPYDKQHMGVFGELCAEKFKFSREEQDDFAKNSYEKTLEAQKQNWFAEEITEVTIKHKKGNVVVKEDEEPKTAQFDKMPHLRSVFKKNGTITAANASKINDGAAACLLASEQAVKDFNLKPIAKIITQSVFAQEPEWFTTAPIYSTQKALKQAGIAVDDIDLFEINEAFSSVALAAQKELNIPAKKLNIHGGAVALGHPIGASGARITATLLHALKTHDKKRGLASICLGGGEACSLIVERV